MKVWLVFKNYTTLQAVNDDLEIASVDVSEVVAVCKTEAKAKKMCAELQAQNDANTKLYDVYPVEYVCGAWEME